MASDRLRAQETICHNAPLRLPDEGFSLFYSMLCTTMSGKPKSGLMIRYRRRSATGAGHLRQWRSGWGMVSLSPGENDPHGRVRLFAILANHGCKRLIGALDRDAASLQGGYQL